MHEQKMPRRTRCEVWTRVMGYHRPVSHFNIGKKSEHVSRTHFKESVAANKTFSERYGTREDIESGTVCSSEASNNIR